MIDRYYTPYHEKLNHLNNHSNISLALDCHSMAQEGPEISPDKGSKRPAICLGNLNGESCPNWMVEWMAECFCRTFDLPEGQVRINSPFSGGYITQKYGKGKMPWIQIEMNRSLYLDRKWFDEKSLNVNSKRLLELNHLFFKTLESFFNLFG